MALMVADERTCCSNKLIARRREPRDDLDRLMDWLDSLEL